MGADVRVFSYSLTFKINAKHSKTLNSIHNSMQALYTSINTFTVSWPFIVISFSIFKKFYCWVTSDIKSTNKQSNPCILYKFKNQHEHYSILFYSYTTAQKHCILLHPTRFSSCLWYILFNDSNSNILLANRATAKLN